MGLKDPSLQAPAWFGRLCLQPRRTWSQIGLITRLGSCLINRIYRLIQIPDWFFLVTIVIARMSLKPDWCRFPDPSWCQIECFLDFCPDCCNCQIATIFLQCQIGSISRLVLIASSALTAECQLSSKTNVFETYRVHFQIGLFPRLVFGDTDCQIGSSRSCFLRCQIGLGQIGRNIWQISRLVPKPDWCQIAVPRLMPDCFR